MDINRFILNFVRRVYNLVSAEVVLVLQDNQKDDAPGYELYTLLAHVDYYCIRFCHFHELTTLPYFRLGMDLSLSNSEAG